MRTARSLALSSLCAAIAAGTVGCGVFGYPAGSIYTGTKVPHGMMRLEGAGAGKGGMSRGKACATGILGLVAFGDASLAAAKRAGGIADVHSVEFGSLSILGIYTQGCTIAVGPSTMPGAGGGGGGGGGAGDGDGDGGGGGGGGRGKGNATGGQGGPGSPGPGGPMQGGPLEGTGGGITPKGGGGGPDRGVGQPPPVIHPDSWKPVPFSFMWDALVTQDGDHQCMTYDPSQPSDPNPFPESKEEIEQQVRNHRMIGHFVDKCPTENVVANCDHRKSRQVMTYFYKGKTQGDLHFMKKDFCENAMFRGVWTWVVPPEPVAKPTPNGPVAFACDTSKTTFQCQTFRSDMDPKKLAEQRALCPMMQGTITDHCPSEGLTGRCEDPATSISTYHYPPMPTELFWQTCDKHGGKWTAP